MLKKVFNIFNQFIFMIILIVFTLLFVLNITICNKDYIIRKMDNYKYFSKLTIDIREEIQNYTIQSGFSKELFDDVFTEDNVRNDIIMIINNYYDNKNVEIDNTTLTEKLNDKINTYLQEKNVKADSRDLEKFNNMVCDAYKTKLTIGNNLKYINKLNIISKVNLVLLPILFLCMLATFIIKLIKRKPEFFISPIFAASLIFIFIDIYVKNKIDIDNILIFGSNFSIILRSIIYSILKYIKLLGIVGLIISILLLVILNIKRIKTCFFYKKVV